MKITKTIIDGVYVLDPEPKMDSRGYFARVFAKEELIVNGIKFDIVHINRSMTKKRGTIRGIHYQLKPRQEDKIIQCLSGSIFDVAVDLRPNSKTYKKWFGIELSAENKKMLLVPKGCGHGFQTLVSDCTIEYFVTQYYSPQHEKGILWSDPAFNINWPIARATLSDKDMKWSHFKPHITK